MTDTEEDVDKLKSWLLEHYKSSTFNVCEHQRLPVMTGEPLQLHVDPDATPVAVHKPTLVPIHWRAAVKEGLDRDVELGVLEKVDINRPVTYCSQMVLTCKHDGSPSHTVDLQPINRQSVRQTHHTEPPFH